MWLDEIPAHAVSPSNDGPLHRQLESALRASITDGTLPAAAQLPTEAELQQKFGISRSVVRQALSALSSEGLVRRGRGRGSIVAPQHEHHRAVQRMSGLSAQISAASGTSRTEVLSFQPGHDNRAEAALGTHSVYALRRRRYGDDEAIAIIHTWLPEPIATSLSSAELTDASLHETMRSKLGIPVIAGSRQIRAVAASEQLATELGIDNGAPLLLLEGTSVDAQGHQVEYFSTWHRADRVVFDITAADDTPDADAHALAAVTASATTATRDASAPARLRELAREMAQLADEMDRG